MEVLDQWVIAILLPLGIWIVLCGLDDLFSAIHYRNFDFFIGIYPNDLPTVQAVQELEARFPNVHSAPTPHDGPTSKADNLNWTYQRMLLFEEQHGCRFDAMVMHDAEDLIHPEALRWINYYLETYDMVQVPVLALPTPVWQFTHGVYCDEFVEYQTRDMFARSLLGGFIPSSGVGTAFSRNALERLAESASNQIFIPGSLTEDYETGLRLHKLECPQLFVPIRQSHGNFVATWEYFPHRFRAAVRQRTRWITGISLQSWALNGWSNRLSISYWFWRDRKGLLGNPTSLLANAILFYGSYTWLYSVQNNVPWGLAKVAGEMWALVLLWATLFLQIWRTGFRMNCVSRVYGWTFAAAVPFRMLWSNWMNCFATISAVYRFASNRLGRKGELKWAKTDHSYPNRGALVSFKPKLGQLLVRAGLLAEEALMAALAEKPDGIRLGEHLLRSGLIGEETLYDTLALQQNIPRQNLSPGQTPPSLLRALPCSLMRTWKIVAFRVSDGCLFLAGPELPTDEMRKALRAQTALSLRFHLITPTQYDDLLCEIPVPRAARAGD